MLPYPDFYRRFGLRLPAQFAKPPFIKLPVLTLPFGASYHYLGSRIDNAPRIDEFMFRLVTRVIPMQHVVDYTSHLGMPRPVTVPIEQEIRRYHAKSRRYRRVITAAEGTRDPKSPMCYNYGFLWGRVKYNRSVLVNYHAWYNAMATVFDNIGATMLEESTRQHFIQIRLPAVIPAMSLFKTAAAVKGGMNQQLLNSFNSPEAWIALELWKWMGAERKESMFHRICRAFNQTTPGQVQAMAGETTVSSPTMAEDTLPGIKRLNLIFVESGAASIVNLGQLDEWRKDSPLSAKTGQGFEASEFQRRGLFMLMQMVKIRSEGIPVDQDASDGEGVSGISVAAVTFNRNEDDDDTKKPADTITAVANQALDKAKPRDETLEAVASNDTLSDRIEFDLKSLEELRSIQAPDAVQASDEFVDLEQVSTTTSMEPPALPLVQVRAQAQAPLSITPSTAIEQLADELAKEGMLTAGDAKKYKDMANTYQHLPAPDGSGKTLAEFMIIEPESLVIAEAPRLREPTTVIDASMASASLNDMAPRYIRDVMEKDIASMVMSVQNGGACVTGYERNRVEDLMNSYDSITIRINPVVGAPGQISIKIPTLQDDGSYLANGTRYRMRMQRGDLPIRKVGPDKVALSSYYGNRKSFVTRTPKKAYDYSSWLNNQLVSIGLDSENTLITGFTPGNVFDNKFKAPANYSTIAMRVRSFTMNGFELNFNHRERKAKYGEEALLAYEKNGSIIVGKDGRGFYLIMDVDNGLSIAKGDSHTVIEPLEVLLGLDMNKAPVSFSIMKVMGRNLPIALLLGWKIGLGALLTKLKASYRTEAAGSRVKLERHEYAIRFNDVTLILSRKDRVASMILAGFNELYRELSDYSLNELNNRDVYLNLIQAAGGSVRHLREIDLMYRMFIDPITLELLQGMNEPTDFEGLLVRASEMLIDSVHPDEMDARYMRDKGNERIAGAIYGELVNSLRVHGSKPNKARERIDMHPFAVWKTIAEDPSLSLVNELNPIVSLKEQEAVTFGGTGGRSDRSMTTHTRSFNDSDIGVISESSVDSGDVGVNIFTSANPRYRSLRGLADPTTPMLAGNAEMLSTSAMLSVAAVHDDQQRSDQSEMID